MAKLFIAAAATAALVAWSQPAETCTVIAVGKKASSDGSVITTHTVDSHRTATNIEKVPRRKHGSGALVELTRREEVDEKPMNRYRREPTGSIPQVPLTFGYLNPAYPPMNEHQVAIGESTFGGREELRSGNGLIDCETLQALMLQRASTAREAIEIGGELIEKYGWIDEGESLAVADPEELWIMEIIGPGEGERGALWAAAKIPDDHVTVVANGARIDRVDLRDTARFLGFAKLEKIAVERGYHSPRVRRPFSFRESFDPDGRRSFAATRREWRVFDVLAPSQKFHPNDQNLPLSIKPDKKVDVQAVMALLRDTYEGTEYDMTRFLTITDEEGKTVKSPLANPFMPYDANKLHRINGGWGWRGERTIARWYTMYATITQSRSGLPDPVGGLVWFGYDNTAMTTYVPIYIGVTDLPRDFRTDGRLTGFSRSSAFWAFNRVGTIAGHRWADMRKEVSRVREHLQTQIFEAQKKVEQTAAALHAESPEKAARYLTRYLHQTSATVVQAYWNLGDLLWTKYDEMW